jgi:hypothetical protein
MVRVINCLSLKKEDMYNFLINDKYSFDSSIMVDTDKPLEFYMNELNHNVVEDILYPLISNNTRQLIFLDSAGGIGYLEYQKVMSLSKDQLNQKVLILDDIYHIKHHRSVLDLKNKGYAVQEYDRFCVVKL